MDEPATTIQIKSFQQKPFEIDDSAAGTLADVEGPKKKDGRFWLVITAVMFTTFIVAEDLNADSYMWVANAYMLTSVAFIPTASSLASLFGRRRTMLGSLLFFAAGSAVCGAAKSMNILIIGRSIQGVGAGALLALAQIVLADLTSLADRGTFLGLSGLVYSLAAVFGPLIGAGFAMSSKNGWRWFFYMNIPICGIAAVLCTLFLNVKCPRLSLAQKLARMDWVNIIFIASSAAFTIGLSFGGVTYPWSSARTLVPLIFGVFGMGAWLYLETKLEYPTVPWEILRRRSTFAGYLQTLIQASSSSLHWFQSVKGSSAMRAAVQTFTMSFTIAPMAIVNGVYVKKTQDFCNPILFAWALLAVGSGVVTVMHPESSAAEWAGLPIISGLALGILSTGCNFAIMAGLQPQVQPHAAGFFTLVRTIGQLLGVTIGATIFQNELNSKVPAAFMDSLSHPSEVAFSAIPLIKDLSEPLRSEVRRAFSDSIHVIWYSCIGFALAGLIASFFMERIKLTTQTSEEYGLKDEKATK
ncbi:MFS general substrate transporter [Meredithblackwellia eburnea MCA 4105]